MSATDKKIADTLAKFDEPMAGNTWKVQSTTVIYHKTLERIAAKAKIAFDLPTILRAEKEEAVLMVVGRMGDRMEWSIGEAAIGMNYRVSGKQAAYPYAMSEKRAKDRVILKLIELHGLVYSEEEADEFKDARPLSTPSSAPSEGEKQAVQASMTREEEIQEFKLGIEKCKTYGAVTVLMQSPGTQAWLEKLPEGDRDEIRLHAMDRMKSLGWQPKRAA